MTEEEEIEGLVDDLIAKAVAVMERYGVTDLDNPGLRLERCAALHKELMQLRPPWLEVERREQQKKIGRKARPELDALIWFELNDTYPGKRMARARELAKSLSKYDNYNISARSIYTKYYQVCEKMHRAR